MNDHEQFTDFYESNHRTVLYAVTAFAASGQIAEEATAEAFVRAFERWDRVRSMRSPGGWVTTVAMNQARRIGRRQRLERRMLVGRASHAGIPDAPLESSLGDLIQPLPHRQRHAVVLRHVLGLTEAEIGGVMGVRRGTVSSLLRTAHASLHDHAIALGFAPAAHTTARLEQPRSAPCEPDQGVHHALD